MKRYYKTFNNEIIDDILYYLNNYGGTIYVGILNGKKTYDVNPKVCIRKLKSMLMFLIPSPLMYVDYYYLDSVFIIDIRKSKNTHTKLI